MKPFPSLRKRLLLLLLSGSAALWALTAVLSYYSAHRQVDELFDEQMAQVAHTLLSVAQLNAGNPRPAWSLPPLNPSNPAFVEQPKLLFQLWDEQQHLLLRSPSAPDTPLTQGQGFAEISNEHGHWRYFALRDGAGRFQVQVGEDHALRDALITKTAVQFMLPILLGVPLLALWIWHATGRGLRPLADITQELQQRGPNHLAELPAAAIPSEVAPLAEAINRLLGQVEQALESERRFTADAAHELRTPLAALHAQLQVAQRARNDEEQQHALTQMQHGLQRANRLVAQMLLLARLDPEQASPNTEIVDLAALAVQVCAELAPQALANDLDLEVHSPTLAPIPGSHDWLAVLLRNLIDNALRYTPSPGQVQVHITEQHGQWQLAVHDSGPGIPPEHQHAALRRFHRLAPQHTPGHGLGLSIVARIAQLHHARLELQHSSTGFSVRVIFAGHPQ